MLNVVMLSVVTLSVVVLSVVMLSVIVLSVDMLSVVAPSQEINLKVNLRWQRLQHWRYSKRPALAT
jgi:hypothetical protein